jgi:glycerol kinase
MDLLWVLQSALVPLIQAGWLEHDPEELFGNATACIDQAVAALGDRASDIRAIGVPASQRKHLISREKCHEEL